ncbi:hypothetical protein BRUM_0361 [Bifidobacterium ruminantium]|uniref:Uncharacterized protein n=1 Tax=Bifidobacterium ruminantium TaxID=78346 RepID=A0A087D4Z2_BIFRU|nr:hypothetical protein BRUM_0361 [Bifidobacterium ruminantium]
MSFASYGAEDTLLYTTYIRLHRVWKVPPFRFLTTALRFRTIVYTGVPVTEHFWPVGEQAPHLTGFSPPTMCASTLTQKAR